MFQGSSGINYVSKLGLFCPIFVKMPRYWRRVNGWLFQNVSNCLPINSGWSQVTPEQFGSVYVHKQKIQDQSLISDFGQNATVLAEGQWVTFSECLKLSSYQLRLVSGNSWAIWKCLSLKNKKSKKVRWHHIYSQNGPDFGQNGPKIKSLKFCSFFIFWTNP